MADAKQTPISSRRFLPASASSKSKSSGPPSVYKSTFQSSLSTQGLPLAPPSTSTPRFRRPAGTPHVKDDIDVSFEGDLDSSALPPTRSVTKVKVFDELEDESAQDQSPSLYRTTHIGRKGEGSTLDEPENRIYPFTPVAKKRKILHLQDQKREPITISSSPEYDQDEDHDEYHTVQQAPNSPVAQHLSDVDLGDEVEAIESPNQRDVTITSRFKDTLSMPQARPSIPKSAFRSLSRSENVPQTSGGPALPDIFSPSKRSGKHEYIASGNAELVRRWVLDIAAQQSQVTQHQHEIVVAKVQLDNSRRFIVTLDTDGSEWLVPGQYQQSRTSLQSGLNNIRPGTKLVLKSEATRWTVPLGASSSGREIAVAAYWEVVP